MSAVDDYFAGLDALARAAFERVSALAEEQVPDAEQGTSYGLAALRHRGKPLLGFKAAKDRLSMFGVQPGRRGRGARQVDRLLALQGHDPLHRGRAAGA